MMKFEPTEQEEAIILSTTKFNTELFLAVLFILLFCFFTK